MGEIFESTLPLLVSVVGWIVVFEQAASLKNRDETAHIVGVTKNTIDEIFDLGVTYYENNIHHIGFISADIRAKFLLLSHYLLLLRSKGLNIDLEQYVVQYRKAIMGGYFETLDFKKQVEIPDRRSDIANARSELKFRLDKIHSDWAHNRSLWRRISGRKR